MTISAILIFFFLLETICKKKILLRRETFPLMVIVKYKAVIL